MSSIEPSLCQTLLDAGADPNLLLLLLLLPSSGVAGRPDCCLSDGQRSDLTDILQIC